MIIQILLTTSSAMLLLLTFPRRRCRTRTTTTTAFMMRGQPAQEIVIQHMATLEKAVLYKSVVILLCSIYLRHSIHSKLIWSNLRRLFSIFILGYFPQNCKVKFGHYPTAQPLQSSHLVKSVKTMYIRKSQSRDRGDIVLSNCLLSFFVKLIF